MCLRRPSVSHLNRVRWSIYAPLLGLSLSLSACQTVPLAKGVETATASVEIEPPAEADTSLDQESAFWNRLQDHKFEAYGAGKLPPDVSGPFQGTAYARATARRAALRALASQIAEFRTQDNFGVEDLLPEEDWRQTLELSLEKRAQVDYKTREGVELARARIEGGSLFTGPAAPGSVGTREEDLAESEPDLIARRRRAEEVATAAAREILYEELLPFGATTNWFGITIPPTPSFKKALREELETVPPFAVDFTDDGECLVHMRYDRQGILYLKR